MSGTVSLSAPVPSAGTRPQPYRHEVPPLRSPAVTDFADRYGPWAIVTGGAQGVGLAFGEALLDRGCSVVLVDRQPEVRRRRRGARRRGPGGGRRPRRPGLARHGGGGRRRASRSAWPSPTPRCRSSGRFLDQPAASRAGHGGGELPGHHRAGGVGPAADGGAGPRGLRRHQLRLGAGGHGRRRDLQRQQGLRAEPGRGDRLGAARHGRRLPGRRGAVDGHARVAIASGRRGRDAPAGGRPAGGRGGRARPPARRAAATSPTRGWSSWRASSAGSASTCSRARPSRSTPTRWARRRRPRGVSARGDAGRWCGDRAHALRAPHPGGQP